MTTFDNLRDQQFINLTTFRRSGTPVATPVWFVLSDEKLVIMTTRSTGKIKRIRNNADVTVAPSTRMGKPIGPDQPGKARIIPLVKTSSLFQALRTKYGLLFRLIQLVHEVRRHDQVFVEVEPA